MPSPIGMPGLKSVQAVKAGYEKERIDAELDLGRHLGLTSELESLSADYPYRERFRAQAGARHLDRGASVP